MHPIAAYCLGVTGMQKVVRIAVVCVVVCAGCSGALCQEQVPEESLCALQETFGMMRDLLWEHSDEFWHRGEFERCIAMARLIVQVDPHDYEAYDTGAWLMQNDFRDQEAEAFLREGVKHNPDAYNMYFYLGYFLYMHERYQEAVAVLEKACAFETPFFVDHMLAHSYEHAGRVRDALAVWRRMEGLERGSAVPRRQIERIMRGGPPSDVPATVQRWRKQRKAEEGRR